MVASVENVFNCGGDTLAIASISPLSLYKPTEVMYVLGLAVNEDVIVPNVAFTIAVGLFVYLLNDLLLQKTEDIKSN